MPRQPNPIVEKHSKRAPIQKGNKREKPDRSPLRWSARFNYNYFNMFKELPLLLQVDAIYGAKKKEYPEPKSILIISTSLIGDFIVSIPAIYYYINKNSNAEIDLVVAPIMQPLARNIRGLRSVYSMNTIFHRRGDKNLKDEWKGKHYDLVLLMRIPKSIMRLLKLIDFHQVKTYLGPFLKFGINMYRSSLGKEELKQMSDVSFEIMGEKDIKIKNIDAGQVFEFNAEEIDRINKLPIFSETEGRRRIIIHTGSGWRVKFWENSRWIEFLTKINQLGDFSFIFIGSGKQEEQAYEYIQDRLDFPVHSVIRQFNIWESLLFFGQCDMFIGIDSGPRHIAHLLDIPSIVLLGPGPKTFEPLNSKWRIIDKSNCGCTNLVCMQKRTCMDKITVEDVVAAFEEELQRGI
jgi:ADP-heptose:LPS heptosyltransferase